MGQSSEILFCLVHNKNRQFVSLQKFGRDTFSDEGGGSMLRTIMFGSGCVAQLVERSLPIPEVRGSNPVFGKNLFILNICFLSTVY